jgi:DNA-binding beta-propeller fold protein YncE
MATVGNGPYTYDVVESWAKLPPGSFGILVGVAVDSRDRVYVCHQRQAPPILIFDREGNHVDSLTPPGFIEGHIMHIDADDILYLVDRNEHVAMKMTLDGKVLLEMGNRGNASDTGITTIGGFPRRAAGPFNIPTRMFPSPSKDLYVSDGYRNARVHRFSSEGELVSSWGSPGHEAPGEFHLPHSLWVDRSGKVYVCDRKNNRIQIFSAAGEFISQWTDLPRVTDIFMDADETVFVHENGEAGSVPRIKVMDKEGNILAQWDSGQGHQIWVDSHGDIYLAITWEQRVDKYLRRKQAGPRR